MDEQIEKALLLLHQKRSKEARNLLMQCLSEDPESDVVFGLLAQLELMEGNLDVALSHIETALRIDPADAPYFLTKARIYVAKREYKEALFNLDQVLSLNPYEALAFAYKAMVFNHKKDFSTSLINADKALAIDPENVLALNLRSTALLKLDRVDEGYETINGALQEDPENTFTHANYGWGLLEKGEGKKALEHFKEALRLDPDNEYAQAGMAEALKANFFVYRWFLQYQFWMSNQVAKNQWIFIIGFYIAYRVLSKISEANPELSIFLNPLLIVLALFAFSTWIMAPISNLLLRINPYGRHLLDEEEVKSSNYVGFSLGVGLLGGLIYLFTNDAVSFALFFLGISLMLPLGRFYGESRTKDIFKYLAVGMTLLGIAAVVTVALSGILVNNVSVAYFFVFIAYQWIANYQVISD